MEGPNIARGVTFSKVMRGKGKNKVWQKKGGGSPDEWRGLGF